MDGVTIYGESYFADLGSDAPLILPIHQGGANGRGECAPIARWLNTEGFRAIAWDQRRGGSTFGESNRTLSGLEAGTSYSCCEAYADLQAALDHVVARANTHARSLHGAARTRRRSSRPHGFRYGRRERASTASAEQDSAVT
jgi:hypothetical protein